MTTKSRAALRWTASLVEPLLSTSQRIQLDHDFREVAQTEPAWFCAFCAGVLSGITSSLPLCDPWRTAKVDTNGVAKWPDGRKFGLREDTNDVIRPIFGIDDAGIDPTTLALEEGVTKDAAKLLVISFGGWRETYAALIGVSFGGWGETDASFAEAQQDHDAAFEMVTSAIHWAQHRRRAYRPESFDAWLDFLVMSWAGWADVVEFNGSLGDLAEREIADGAEKERELLAKIADALEFFVRQYDVPSSKAKIIESAKETAAKVKWTMALEAQNISTESLDAMVSRSVARKVAELAKISDGLEFFTDHD
jgi:hypothetical protein